jgi:hypothetical protein
MKEPRLPGFTADHSLYRTNVTYRMRRSGNFSESQVMPAAINTGVKCDRVCSACARTGSEVACAVCERCEEVFPI